MGFVRKIRGSIPGQAVPLVQDREMIQDANTGDVYIGHNGSNKLVSGNGSLLQDIATLQSDKVNVSEVSVHSDPNTIVRRDASGNIEGKTEYSGEADELKNARKISISGGATGSDMFDGSRDISISIEIDPDKHDHKLTDLTDFPDLSGSAGMIVRIGQGGALVPGTESTPENVYTTNEVDDLLSQKASASHNHNDDYYTESEIDTKLSGKASSTHNHNGDYYTESEIDSRLDGKSNTGHVHDDLYYRKSNIDERMIENSSYATTAVNAAQTAVAASASASASANIANDAMAAADQSATDAEESANQALTYKNLAELSEQTVSGRVSEVNNLVVAAQNTLDELIAMGPRGIGNVDGGNAFSTYLPIQNLNGGTA